MRATNDQSEAGKVGGPENSSIAPDAVLEGTRVEFRHASGHLGEKRPGFYLILLRNEIRHRTLRDKPALNV